MKYTETPFLLKKTVSKYTEVPTSCFSERNFLGIHFLKKETVK